MTQKKRTTAIHSNSLNSLMPATGIEPVETVFSKLLIFLAFLKIPYFIAFFGGVNFFLNGFFPIILGYIPELCNTNIQHAIVLLR